MDNSEIGLVLLSISVFLLWLVCTNGLISKTEVEASYRHISLRILDEFSTAIGDVGAKLLDEKHKLQFSLE